MKLDKDTFSDTSFENMKIKHVHFIKKVNSSDHFEIVKVGVLCRNSLKKNRQRYRIICLCVYQ